MMKLGLGPSFGAGGPNAEHQGIVHDPEDEAISKDPLAAIAGYLRRIAHRYDLPFYEDIQNLNLTTTAPGNTKYFQYQNQEMNAFTLSSNSGTIGLWLGDFSTATALPTPHFTVAAGGNIQIFLNPKIGRQFTVQSIGGAATGTFIAMAV